MLKRLQEPKTDAKNLQIVRGNPSQKEQEAECFVFRVSGEKTKACFNYSLILSGKTLPE